MKKAKRLLAMILITVLTISSVPVTNETYAATKPITVRTQKEYNKAIKKTNKITISTKMKNSFVLSKVSSKKKSLTIKAPKSKVTNQATFSKIDIKDVNKFQEKASTNKLNITDKDATISLTSKSSNTKINLNKTGAFIQIEANGKSTSVTINKKATVTMSGVPKNTVKVINKGAKSTLKLNPKGKLNITIHKKTSTIIGNKVKDATIILKTDDFGTIENNSKIIITVKKPDGSTIKLDAGDTLSPSSFEDEEDEEDTEQTSERPENNDNTTPPPTYPTEKPVEKPVEESSEESTEQTSERPENNDNTTPPPTYPTEKPVEKPVEESSEESTEEKTDIEKELAKIQSDTDDDGLSDWLEEAYGASTTKSDTDGDGLSDYIEIYETGTDPTLSDTDGNGVPDIDEDSDGDGFTNKEEIQLGTSLSMKDTDSDGLNDYEEVKNYHTNPLKADSDGDGAIDGWEIDNNYDPLSANESFMIEEKESDGKVEAAVVLSVEGEQTQTLSVEAVTDDAIINESIPGYLGSAYNFTLDGSFRSADISFSFDENYLEDEDFEPAIYYYNERTQLLEELPTQLDGNTATTTVSHFSTYILLNKKSFEEVWNYEIKPPLSNNITEDDSLDIVFVIDYSNSMEENDGNKTFRTLSEEFISKLRTGKDKAAVVKFIATSELVQESTSDKMALYTAINSIEYDSGFNWNSGTNGSAGYKTALDELSNSTAKYKYILFMTDGEDNRSSYNYDDLIQESVDNDITVYTIGMGNAVESILEEIADGTGGAYYRASDTSELADSFHGIQEDTIDLAMDSNDDGISDYYTHLLCDGRLRLGSGAENPFDGMDYETIQGNKDYDGDGLDNGEEIFITKIGSVIHVQMISDPTLKDTDFDGMDDISEDESCRNNNKITASLHYEVKVDLYDKFIVHKPSVYDIPVSFNWDYRYFFKNKTTFSKNLAVLGSLLVNDMYDDSYLDFSKGQGTTGLTNAKDKKENTQSHNQGQGVSFLETFKLENVENYNATQLLNESSCKYEDKDDVTEFTVGHKNIEYNNEKREIIIIALRGTNGTSAEWSSNFDVGADSDNYRNMTGKHTLWKDLENHKGFDVAANRVKEAFKDYEKRYNLSNNTKKSIFIVGHSRAAAIANILGTYFEDGVDFTGYDSYVYTYATPNTTTKQSTNYTTIFNIVNEDDIVPCLPLDTWGFSRYGTNKNISVKDNFERKLFPKDFHGLTTFESLLKEDYNSNGQLEKTKKAFKALGITDRKDLYVYDNGSDGTVNPTNNYYYDEDKVQTEFLRLMEEYENEKLLKYCQLKIEDQFLGRGAYVSCTYCPAFLMQTLANITAFPCESSPTLGRDVKGKYRAAKSSFVKTSGYILVGGMPHPHMPPTYYLISMNNMYRN